MLRWYGDWQAWKFFRVEEFISFQIWLIQWLCLCIPILEYPIYRRTLLANSHKEWTSRKGKKQISHCSPPILLQIPSIQQVPSGSLHFIKNTSLEKLVSKPWNMCGSRYAASYKCFTHHHGRNVASICGKFCALLPFSRIFCRAHCQQFIALLYCWRNNCAHCQQFGKWQPRLISVTTALCLTGHSSSSLFILNVNNNSIIIYKDIKK